MNPPVWRRILVDDQTSFLTLHELIQDAFDWDDSHLHEFTLPSKGNNGMFARQNRIGPNDDIYGDGSTLNEAEEIIASHLMSIKDKVIYTYDFGDDWAHEILLENIMYPENGSTYPRCIKAKGMAPEEDSGGLWWDDEEEFGSHVDEKLLVDEINKQFEPYVVEVRIDSKIAIEQENWHELFRLIDEYKSLSPWQQFWDTQMIAIENPVTNEMAYCCILGKSGEEFGLAVYLGDDGLLALRKIMENPEFSSEEIMLKQRSLLLSLADRDELESDDYALIKNLDLRFRGKKQWPMFRSFKPGYYPWTIDQEEVQILKSVLEEVNEVVKQFRNDPQGIPEYGSEKWLTLLSIDKESAQSKQNTMITHKVEALDKERPNIISEIDMKRVKKKIKQFEWILEFDIHHIPMPVQKNPGDRPFFPMMVLAADHKQGVIVFSEILDQEQYEQNLQYVFLNIIEKIEVIPTELWIENNEIIHILQHLLEDLSIRVVKVDQLPVVTHFIKGMEENM